MHLLRGIFFEKKKLYEIQTLLFQYVAGSNYYMKVSTAKRKVQNRDIFYRISRCVIWSNNKNEMPMFSLDGEVGVEMQLKKSHVSLQHNTHTHRIACVKAYGLPLSSPVPCD